MRNTSLSAMACPAARALDVVGEWWTLLIIRDALRGARRFEEFKRAGISDNILTARLRRLVEAGIFERSRYQQRPDRYEYLLTGKGRAAARPLRIPADRQGPGPGPGGGGTARLGFNVDRGSRPDQDRPPPLRSPRLRPAVLPGLQPANHRCRDRPDRLGAARSQPREMSHAVQKALQPTPGAAVVAEGGHLFRLTSM